MHVDQRQVTTIDLIDGQTHNFVLLKDGWGYKLTSATSDEVVNIFLSANDLQRLRQELAKPEVKEFKREHQPVRAKPDSTALTAGSCVFQWSTMDWLSFN